MFIVHWGFPGGPAVKNPSAMQEMQVQSLGWEDPLVEETATYSSILAWEVPRTEESGRLQSVGSQRIRLEWACMTQEYIIWNLWYKMFKNIPKYDNILLTQVETTHTKSSLEKNIFLLVYLAKLIQLCKV